MIVTISKDERYGFVGEIKISTFRNYFREAVPKGHDVFYKLKEGFTSGNNYVLKMDARTVEIKDFSISNSRHAELLFKMTDPGIPDNVWSDRTNGKLRPALRTATEDPAVSAHVLVDLADTFDVSRAYPTCIENIDYLPRSLIIQFFNEWLAKTLAEKRIRHGELAPKIFQPRFEFIAPTTQTIQDALDKGGILRGVKWVESNLTENTFGDKAYPVEKRTDIGLIVRNRPTGDAAKGLLSSLWEGIRGKNPKTIKVLIEDENDRIKTIGIDPSKNNVLSNIFIPQKRFGEFYKPMAMCEASIRKDLIKKMKSAIA